MPIVRPVFGADAGGAATANGNASGLIRRGRSLLVSPIVQPLTNGSAIVVDLPPGRWYEYHTGKPVDTGSEACHFQSDLYTARYPVFVKAGEVLFKRLDELDQ